MLREDGGREENCIPSFNILIVMGAVEGIRIIRFIWTKKRIINECLISKRKFFVFSFFRIPPKRKKDLNF